MKDLSPVTKGGDTLNDDQKSTTKSDKLVALGISVLIGCIAVYIFGSSGDIYRDSPVWVLAIASSVTMYRSISKRAKSNLLAH